MDSDIDVMNSLILYSLSKFGVPLGGLDLLSEQCKYCVIFSNHFSGMIFSTNVLPKNASDD